MGIILPEEEWDALRKRTPRKKVSCVECGEKAEADRKGDWRCLASREIPTGPVEVDPASGKVLPFATISILTCGARGVTLPDGYMATTQGPPIEVK